MALPLQIRQIEKKLRDGYYDNIILRESENTKKEDELDKLRLSRSVLALVMDLEYGALSNNMYGRIVDGYDDNGIDAVYYNKDEKKLVLMQSKWISEANNGLSLGDTLKFIKGVRDLVNAEFGNFNKELSWHVNEINNALMDPNTAIILTLIATTTQPIPTQSKDVIDEFLEDANGVSEQFYLEYFDLKRLHNLIKDEAYESPVKAQLLLSHWYEINHPARAIGGLVSGEDLACLLDIQGKKLFSPNIRYFLGATEVNDSILETVKAEPGFFWYYNNGITAISTKITKAPLGGDKKDTGLFECDGFSVINGAQTIGSLLKAKELGHNTGSITISIRIIEIAEDNSRFELNVTRKNNTQNKIDSRDFVALERNQRRIYDELIVEGIVYAYKSGDIVPDGIDGFGFEEAAISRACFLGDVGIMVQAKREISKLWNNVYSAPYTALFNGSVEGPRLWHIVKVFRQVENWIHLEKKNSAGKKKLFLSHSNRYLLMLVMKGLKDKYNIEAEDVPYEDIQSHCSSVYEKLVEAISELYENSVLGSLFKNKSKCEAVFKQISTTSSNG